MTGGMASWFAGNAPAIPVVENNNTAKTENTSIYFFPFQCHSFSALSVA